MKIEKVETKDMLKLKIMKKILCSGLIISTCFGTLPTFASAPETKIITTREDLITELKEINLDGSITKSEQQSIIDNTDERVLEAFVSEKIDQAFAVFEEQNIQIEMTEKSDGSCYGQRKFDLGDECFAEVVCEDKDDLNAIEKLAVAIDSMFLTNVWAKTKSSTVTKEYGNRYYSVSFVVYIGGGTATIALENHYKLSASGIEERYGVSDSSCVGLGVSMSEDEPIITDNVATQPGKSDTNMYCKYHYTASAAGVWNTSGVKKISSRLIYNSINKTKKTINLTQESTMN